MQVDYILPDEEFGHLYIKRNARAVRYTFRPAHDGGQGILITAPRLFAMPDLQRAVEEMRPRLRAMIERDAALQEQQRQHPQPTPEQLAQDRRAVERMRALAKRDLPPMLLALARQYGFTVHEVKINSARTRWGSCVARKHGLFGRKQYTINLSLYCILLPPHLQRLVMLHELTHIHHMDHSPAFHRELDAMLDGQEKVLNQELRAFSMSPEDHTLES